jgi:hypothetical protein
MKLISSRPHLVPTRALIELTEPPRDSAAGGRDTRWRGNNVQNAKKNGVIVQRLWFRRIGPKSLSLHLQPLIC